MYGRPYMRSRGRNNPYFWIFYRHFFTFIRWTGDLRGTLKKIWRKVGISSPLPGCEKISTFMILIIISFICQEANASFGKVLIHPSYFHVHFLFSTFTPFFFNDACCCGAAFPLYLLESGGMFFGGGAISSEPQETTPCQKRRWRGREGAAWGSVGKKDRRNYKIFVPPWSANVSQWLLNTL